MSMYVGNVVDAGVLTLVGTTVVRLPAEARNLEGVSCAHIDVEGGAIRFYVHGDDPSPIAGHPVAEDSSFTVVGGGNVQELRMVAQSAELGAAVTWSVGTGAAPIALYGESLLRRLSIIENAAASGATLNYEFLFSDPD